MNSVMPIRLCGRKIIFTQLRLRLQLFIFCVIYCLVAVLFLFSTKLGWRKFRRRISEFIATLAEFSPVIIGLLLDGVNSACVWRMKMLQRRKIGREPVTLHELLIWRN